jgi:hypothetical protein
MQYAHGTQGRNGFYPIYGIANELTPTLIPYEAASTVVIGYGNMYGDMCEYYRLHVL